MVWDNFCVPYPLDVELRRPSMARNEGFGAFGYCNELVFDDIVKVVPLIKTW